MASTPSSSSLFTSRGAVSTPLSNKATDLRSRRSTTAFDFGTPISIENTSPFPASSSKSTSLLSKTPFGTPSRLNVAPSATQTPVQPPTTPSLPPQPLTGSAKLTARIRSLWLGGGHATASLQGKSFLPYSGLAKLMLQTNLDRLYALSFLSIHLFLSISLFAPLQPISSLLLPARPSLLLLSMIAFSISILPLILLRRMGITDTKPSEKSNTDAVLEVATSSITPRYGSPATHYFSVLYQKNTGLSIVAYAMSGLFLAASHAAGLMLYSTESNSWAPYHSVSFRNPQGLRVSSFRPNERLFFLLGSNLIIGALYTLHRALSLSPSLCDASSPLSPPTFEPQATVESVGARLSGKLRRRLPHAVLAGSTLPSIFLVSYFAIRRPLFRMILSVIGHNSALRPLLIPSFRQYFLSVGLVFRSTALGVFSTVTWEIINILWEVFSTQPFADLPGGLSGFSREPTKCLIEGIQSRRLASTNEPKVGPLERDYYAHFAFAELALLAATDVDRRRAIFREVGSANAHSLEGGTKSAWVSIAHECLEVIKEERLCISTRGRQQVAAASVTAQSNALHLKALHPSHKALLEEGGNVVRKGPATIWDRLASPSAPATAPARSNTAAPASSSPPTNDSNGLVNIFHQLAPSPASDGPAKSATPISATKKTTGGLSPSASSARLSFILSSMTNVCKTLFLLLPSDLRHVLSRLPIIRSLPATREQFLTPSNQTLLYTGKAPKDAALTTWSIQTLSALLSASIDQDEYGTVALSDHQKLGVDDVLEEMANLLLELSKLGQDIAKEMQGESESKKQELTLLWDRKVAPIVIATRTALSLVLGVFEPTGFRLRPIVQEKVDLAMAAG